MDKDTKSKLIWIAVFAAAMGFLEAVVVIYLRKMYSPSGFNFPLNVLSTDVIFVEWLREIATIVMLVAIGYIAGKTCMQKLSYFLYSFAIWDLAYYLWLKIALGWPASFLTWDLLFLIPVFWIGPVLAPIINSTTIILMALLILKKGKRFDAKEWTLIILGALIILYTYIIDYARLIVNNGFLSDFFHLVSNQNFLKLVSNYVPAYYNWPLFILGEALILGAMWLYYKD